MKASELRIGNYVTTLSGKEVLSPTMITEKIGNIGFFEVELYDYKKSFAEQIGRKTDISNLSPIPLTEEWLLKFEIERKVFTLKDIETTVFSIPISEDLGLYICLHFQLGRMIKQWLVVDEYEHDYYGIIDELFTKISDKIFVHDLQNWYYFTTKLITGKGEELTIKEDEIVKKKG